MIFRFSLGTILSMFIAVAALAQHGGRERVEVDIDYSSKPKKYILKAVNVAGNYSVADTSTLMGNAIKESEKRVIQAVSGLAPGMAVDIPGDDITKAIRNLWRQQLFSKVGIEVDSAFVENEQLVAYITINVETRPRLSKYSFPGLKKGEQNKLKEEAKISRRDVITPQLFSNVEARIKRYYVEKGRPNAKVVINARPDPEAGDNYQQLIIRVDKGKRVKISEVKFSGNEHLSEAKLKRALAGTKEKLWYFPVRSSKYQPETYETDKSRVLAYYHSMGYKDAKITADTVKQVAENRVAIHINVEEGPRYYFRNITWSGNTKYTTAELNRILGIKKGDVYNTGVMDQALFMNQAGMDVTSLYMDDGYLFFNLTPVETHLENDSVDIEIRIFEGPQAIINRVTVAGNTRTHDKVLLREIRTKPGQKFSRSDIIRSQRELVQMGLFDQEKMNVNPKPNPKDGTVDLEYVVSEKPSDRVELSGGYGAGQLVGVLGLQLNNFSARRLIKGGWQGYPSGDAQQLAIRAQSNGIMFQSYNISFTEPWFGGRKPNSLTLSAFYSVQRYGLYASPDQRSELYSPGGTIGLGKRLKWPDDYFTLYNSANYNYYTYKNYPLIAGFNSGYSNNFNFRHILTRNSADAPIYPTSGSIVTTSLQWTPPYSLLNGKDYENIPRDHEGLQQRYKFLEYYKYKLSFNTFTSLTRYNSRRFVIASTAEFGMLGNYNKVLGTTPFERFYVGGDGLTGYNLDGRELIRFRGYPNSNAVTPAITDLKGNILEPGGTIYNKFSMELRYPITTSPSATIFVLGFLEAGNAWQRFENYDPFTLKRSAGGGVRLFLPMFGLLGFDYGYGFDPTIQNPTKPSGGNFHFYIGQPLF